MCLKTLKDQVEHDTYVVDVNQVAAAMLRRITANRRNEVAITRRGARVRAIAARNPRPRI
jgi:hypothetical protein